MSEPVLPTTSEPAPTAEPGALSAAETALVGDAARSWASVPRPRVETGPSFIDPDLDVVESRGARAGERYVRVIRSRKHGFEKIAPGWLQATPRASAPTSGVSSNVRKVRRFLLGAPMATHQLAHERLTKLKALAVLSSDALSSVAYATEQIIAVLGTAAVAAAFGFTIPIAIAIVCLLAIVVLSYRQTIKAYPKGGGSYIVASDNLGHLPGLLAGCALMTSYIMTVAVSVASGTDAIISAAPAMSNYRVALCLGFVLLLMLGNLRGIKEAGSIFALPTYLFIFAMFLTVGTVLFRLATGTLDSAPTPVPTGDKSLGIGLILLAFASGATALTGVEAISDGVPAFKAPEWRNARATLTSLGVILTLMFVGITVCTVALGVVAQDPNKAGYQTVISQIAHHAFSNNAIYYYVQFATTAILVLAGNTAFSDFPRLLFFMARDHYAPHFFGRLGDRLAFSNGIIVLTSMSALALILSGGVVRVMIPLYATGVFTAFTLSQSGMVMRWLRKRESGWHVGLPMNILGVFTTGLVLAVTVSVNFKQGAFVIVLVVPVLVAVCLAIHRHYTDVDNTIANETPTSPDHLKPVCIVPVAELNSVALQSLALARTFSDSVIAIHVCDQEDHIAKMRAKWDMWGNHVPLEIIESPYRTFVRPLLRYIDAIDRQRSDDTLIVILPELVATKWWHQLLHNQSALRLKAALLFRPGTVVVSVPYHLRRHPKIRRRARANKDHDAL